MPEPEYSREFAPCNQSFIPFLLKRFRNELLELLDKQTVQESERAEPLLANYLKAIDEFVAEAKANPDEDFL